MPKEKPLTKEQIRTKISTAFARLFQALSMGASPRSVKEAEEVVTEIAMRVFKERRASALKKARADLKEFTWALVRSTEATVKRNDLKTPGAGERWWATHDKACAYEKRGKRR